MCSEDLAASIQRGQSRWMRMPVGLSDLRQEGAPWKEAQNKLVLLPVLIRVNGQPQSVCCIFLLVDITEIRKKIYMYLREEKNSTRQTQTIFKYTG